MNSHFLLRAGGILLNGVIYNLALSSSLRGISNYILTVSSLVRLVVCVGALERLLNQLVEALLLKSGAPGSGFRLL